VRDAVLVDAAHVEAGQLVANLVGVVRTLAQDLVYALNEKQLQVRSEVEEAVGLQRLVDGSRISDQK